MAVVYGEQKRLRIPQNFLQAAKRRKNNRTMKKIKQQKWSRLRHRFFVKLATPVVWGMSKFCYHAKVETFPQAKERPYLVLMNHQTAFDGLLVNYAFRKRKMYTVTTEDIHSNGWISSLLRFAVRPIPINKRGNDLQCVRNCIRIAREGASVAIAPEGNSTFSGYNCYIKPSIVKMIRLLQLPVALFRIEGGFGVRPRWCDKIRRGKMRAYVSQVIERGTYERMTDDELYNAIVTGLHQDDNLAGLTIKSRHKAEYLERALYTCPHCGITEWQSKGNFLTCTRCGKKVEYTSSLTFRGQGEDAPYPTVGDWYRAQEEYVLHRTFAAEEQFGEDSVSLFRVIPYRKKVLLHKKATLKLFGDRVEIVSDDETLTLPFDRLGMAICGKNKLNLYFGEDSYQIRGGKRFCAVKYYHLCVRHRLGEKNGEFQFLGL